MIIFPFNFSILSRSPSTDSLEEDKDSENEESPIRTPKSKRAKIIPQ